MSQHDEDALHAAMGDEFAAAEQAEARDEVIDSMARALEAVQRYGTQSASVCRQVGEALDLAKAADPTLVERLAEQIEAEDSHADERAEAEFYAAEAVAELEADALLRGPSMDLYARALGGRTAGLTREQIARAERDVDARVRDALVRSLERIGRMVTRPQGVDGDDLVSIRRECQSAIRLAKDGV